MARAELDIILDKLQGRLTGNSRFYVTNRYGKTVISNYPLHKDNRKHSANQRATFSSFGECSKRAKSELSDPERLAYWQNRYDEYKRMASRSLNRANERFFGIDPNTTPQSKQKYYVTLRGFIIAHLRKETE